MESTRALPRIFEIEEREIQREGDRHLEERERGRKEGRRGREGERELGREGGASSPVPLKGVHKM